MIGWREELRSNSRLRFGLVAIAALLWLLVLLELSSARDAAREERNQLTDEVIRLRSVRGEQQWMTLLAQAQQRLADFRSLAWL